MWAVIKILWPAIPAAILTGLLAWGLRTLEVNNLNAQHAIELANQKQILENQCLADKKLTEGVSRGYQSEIALLNEQLASVKRVRPRACIIATPKPAAGRDAAAAARQPAERNGVDTDTLYDFAAKAEQYRLQLLGCQRFITDVWTSRGQ